MRYRPVLFTGAIFSVLAAASLSAQTGTHPEPVGIVTGRVTCSDTQRPARLAQVKLVRVPTRTDLAAEDKGGSFAVDTASIGNAVETSLDGSYSLRNVKAGKYYLVVDKPGYLMPLAQFSLKELAATDDETRGRVASVIQPITINGGQSVQQDVVLDRGASVSGTVSYDDGTLASGLGVQLLTKDAKGKWVAMETRYGRAFGNDVTDDFGHYRITGLPSGAYVVEANLSLSEHKVSYGPMPNSPGTMVEFDLQTTRFALPVYSGDVFRRTEATAVPVGAGEVRAGTDLIFALAKLHKVNGQVIAKDGHALNDGLVHLLNADDRSELTSASIVYDDEAFHLDFIPEGSFILKAADAKDVTHVQVENTPGYTPRFHEETHTVHTYGEEEQPLTVAGDVSDVILTVPPAK